MSAAATNRSRQLITLGAGVISVCLVVIGVLSYYQSNHAPLEERLFARSQAVVASLETMQALVRDADAHRRLAQAAGANLDLQPLTSAIDVLDRRMIELGEALRESPGQLHKLLNYQGLVRLHRDFLALEATQPAANGNVKPLTAAQGPVLPIAEMERLLGDIADDANRFARTRNDQRRREARNVRALLLMSVAFSIVGGFVVALQARNSLRRQRQFESEAQEMWNAMRARDEALLREKAARQEAERANLLKDTFLATVSHELRTPLNAIVGWVHVMSSGTLNEHDTNRALEAIHRNVRRQSELVDDLLDVSGMIQGRFKLSVAPTDLRNAVDAAIDHAQAPAEARRVALHCQQPDEPVLVLGDAARLQQVAWQLITNGIKFTPPGGRIDVAVVVEDSHARLTVADTGDGIEPDFLAQVFEPFVQGTSRSMRAGLGLGLAIVREVVELHGGTVAAGSRGPQQGTTFTVVLPLMAQPRGSVT